MARRVKQAGDDRGSSPPAKQPKVKKSKAKGVFRSIHRGLKIVLGKSERIDHGAGSYTVVPPKMAEFEDRGSYGEYEAGPEDATKLREIAQERKDLKLPPKFTEV